MDRTDPTKPLRVPVIVGSTRRGRQSPKVARFVMCAMPRFGFAASETDLRDYHLPFLIERLKYLQDPPDELLRFAQVVADAPALVVISPEYNGGYPGVLKNALDHLNEQYEDKPVAIVTVSAGPNGGASCLDMLTTAFRRLGAIPLKSSFTVNLVEERFDDDGSTSEEAYEQKRALLLADLASACRPGTGGTP